MKYYLNNQNKFGNCFILPNSIMQLDLSPMARLIYFYLVYIEDRKTYQCYPSYRTIGKALKIESKTTVAKYVRELDAKFAEKCGVGDYEFLGDELKVDIAVDEGDIIKAGDMEFEVVNLPGHTRCSVGFYCRRKGLFLSNETLDCLKNGKSDEEILRMIKDKFWHEYIKAIYPEDAVNLNTSIMIQLIKNFFLKNA